jgi:hypothetical protein
VNWVARSDAYPILGHCICVAPLRYRMGDMWCLSPQVVHRSLSRRDVGATSGPWWPFTGCLVFRGPVVGRGASPPRRRGNRRLGVGRRVVLGRTKAGKRCGTARGDRATSWVEAARHAARRSGNRPPGPKEEWKARRAPSASGGGSGPVVGHSWWSGRAPASPTPGPLPSGASIAQNAWAAGFCGPGASASATRT